MGRLSGRIGFGLLRRMSLDWEVSRLLLLREYGEGKGRNEGVVELELSFDFSSSFFPSLLFQTFTSVFRLFPDINLLLMLSFFASRLRPRPHCHPKRHSLPSHRLPLSNPPHPRQRSRSPSFLRLLLRFSNPSRSPPNHGLNFRSRSSNRSSHPETNRGFPPSQRRERHHSRRPAEIQAEGDRT